MRTEVPAERNGWRDEGLSRRHRAWGLDAPAVDLDFLMVEYDCAQPRAIVEYKCVKAAPQFSSHPSYRAVRILCDNSRIPFIGCRYSQDFCDWLATPLNEFAKAFLPERANLDEASWVELLYAIRQRRMPEPIRAICYRTRPSALIE